MSKNRGFISKFSEAEEECVDIAGVCSSHRSSQGKQIWSKHVW